MDWLDVMQRFGFPVVAFFLVCYGVSKVVTWVASEVVKPMVKGHIDFLTDVRGFLSETKTMMKTHEKVTIETSEQMKNVSKTMVEIQASVYESMKTNSAAVNPGKPTSN